MYTRITRSGGRRYLQIVEGYRTPAGVRQRVVACWRRLKTDHLCRLKTDQGKEAEGRSLGCG